MVSCLKPGHCPQCKTETIDCGRPYVDDEGGTEGDMLYVPVQCPRCGWWGRENRSMTFIETIHGDPESVTEELIAQAEGAGE